MRGMAVDHSVTRRYFALNFIALMTNLKIWPSVLIFNSCVSSLLNCYISYVQLETD